jgi:hypothetical protein
LGGSSTGLGGIAKIFALSWKPSRKKANGCAM